MTSLIDQAKDFNGQRLWALLGHYQPPEFVKKASSEKVVGNNDLPPSVYGDPRTRLFPCHTAAATWVSALFFHDQKQAMDRTMATMVEGRIDRAAKHHGITGIVHELKEAVARNSQLDESARPDEDFMLVYETPSGTERHYPMRTDDEVKRAAAYLKLYAKEYAFSDRTVMAEKVLVKSAGSVELDDDTRLWLERQAGHGTCSAATAAKEVEMRAAYIRICGDEKTASSLDQIAESIRTDPEASHLPSRLRKLASILDRVDREYALPMTDPADTLFKLNEKTASEFHAEHVPTTTGNLYSRQDFQKLALDDIEGAMGSDFAEQVKLGNSMVDVEKLAELVPTLPRPDAVLFDKLAERAGLRPRFKQAGERLLQNEDLVAIAGEHQAEE